MSVAGIKLSVDYGHRATVAVLGHPDGRVLPLPFGGATILSSGVAVTAEGSILAGDQAWRLGLAAPDRYLAEPGRLLGNGPVRLAGRDVDPIDLVAATLRLVAAEACLATDGADIVEVVIATPPAWSATTCTWVRVAASRTALSHKWQGGFRSTAETAAVEVMASRRRVPPGAMVVVCRLDDATAELALLRRIVPGIPTGRATGYEVYNVADVDQLAGGSPLVVIDRMVATAVLMLRELDVAGDQLWAVIYFPVKCFCSRFLAFWAPKRDGAAPVK